MSTESVVKFLETAEADSSITERLRQADATTEAWIAVASEAGFEFGSDDLRAVSEALTGKEQTDATCVQAIIDWRAAELSDDALEGVAGGTNLQVSFQTAKARKPIGGLIHKGVQSGALGGRRGDLGGRERY
jgi:predicted ribosomally synthesized peptide with nif11-like leader